MKKSIIITVVEFLVMSSCFAQVPNNGYKPLKVGDSIPDFKFSHVVNYSKKTLTLSDIKDKLIIFDFWTTTCAPCIGNFPKLDSLQRKFQEKVQFLPIDWEEKERMDNFLARILKKRKLAYPFVHDTVVKDYFIDTNGYWLGQYVWIKEGKIIGLTSHKQINEENILKVLTGKGLASESQKKIGKTFPGGFEKPFLLNSTDILENKTVKYQSIMTGFLPGYNRHIQVRYSDNPADRDYDGISGIRLINMSLFGLYCYVYDDLRKKFVIESRDVQFISPPDNNDSNRLFCYELLIPLATESQLKNALALDLKKIFPYTISEQNRVVRCVVLRKLPTLKLSTKGGEPRLESTGLNYLSHNLPFEGLVNWLNKVKGNAMFVVDETGIPQSEKVDIAITLSDAPDRNPESLIEELKKYGLQLTYEQREQKVAVIGDISEDKISKNSIIFYQPFAATP